MKPHVELNRAIKQTRENLVDAIDDIESQIAELEQRKLDLDRQLEAKEEQWLLYNDCSCGLIGVDCPHS